MLRLHGRLLANCCALILGIGLAGSSLRAENITTRKVKFKQGTSSQTLKGSVKGYDTIRYELEAKKGQKMSAKLKSSNRFLYFNVLNKRTGIMLEAEPVPREVIEWSGKLPENGTYVVQVYLVRAEARRGRKADYSLSLSITGKG